jgi:hypothetical protein
MGWTRIGVAIAALLITLVCAPAAMAATTRPSAWDEPVLTHPTVVTISDSERNLKLDPTKDYILECPPGPVRLSWPLVVWGGHNVVFEDCHLHVTVPNWGGEFKDQTGTLWVSDVRFGGRRPTGGVQLQEPHATVVMRDVLFDRVRGSYATNHAECIQSWSGPWRLLIDGLQCPTTYQGLFLLPNQWGSAPRPKIFDLRHIVVDDRQGAVALWISNVRGGLRRLRVHLDQVYVLPNPAKTWRGWWLWPPPPNATWHTVVAGRPPGCPYVRPVWTGATGVDEDVSPPPLRDEQQLP